MTDLTHYVEFRTPRDAERAEVPMLLARVVSTVHGFNLENFPADGLSEKEASEVAARRLAVAFVGYDDDASCPTPGTGIRVFSNEATLAAFLSSRHGAFSRTAMSPGAVKSVPEGHAQVVFFRKRQDERMADAWLLRTESRMERLLGEKEVDREEFNKSLLQRRRWFFEKRSGRAKEGRDVTAPYLKIRSGSTGRSFSLFIGKNISTEKVSGGVNSYGLSGKQGRSVPFF